ncbi:HTH-type transcriptional repressor KstR2 [Leminorella richardii]|uniref:HTH-type transcriptional repressor KstR2 n=1 Tax=Leminorella richardii TaxID=158841 RepID=A0A2X4Y5Z7_9GAMM|nr:TetR/AcrR family transcriptional regulator [Leminorella richardii]SQI43934.1 HTH-type transcriptional repressor KstR2 [Leminorella richardii]
MYIDTSRAQSLKDRLLLCAINEFAEYGYEGARVDNIVKAADCSKQTVYHHFGNKENLFIEVLEYTWNDIRQRERELDLSGLEPKQAIERIVDFTWDYYVENPWFLKIVNSENQSKGEHYKKSTHLPHINHAHLQLMASLLEEGKKQKVFKPDIDPLQVNINIAALGAYYLINQHTLGQVYNISMVSPQALDIRRKVIKETIMSWLLQK